MRPTDAVSPAALETADHDLGPLAWVLDELRKSLDGAIKAMRRHVHEASLSHGAELGSADVSALRLARQQMHQATGALEMVGMAPVALMMRALEAMAQKFIQTPSSCTPDTIGLIERASFAISEYLEAVLAGHEVSAVSLFPQFRELQRGWAGGRGIRAAWWAANGGWPTPACPTAWCHSTTTPMCVRASTTPCSSWSRPVAPREPGPWPRSPAGWRAPAPRAGVCSGRWPRVSSKACRWAWCHWMSTSSA